MTRTSCGHPQPSATLAAHARASSRVSTSMTVIPPRYSGRLHLGDDGGGRLDPAEEPLHVVVPDLLLVEVDGVLGHVAPVPGAAPCGPSSG